MRKSNRISLPEIIEQVDPKTLRFADNPIHKDDPLHVEKIAGSMDQFDFVDPVLVGPNNEIIDGEQRVKAAMRQGHATVPIMRLKDATPRQVTAIRIALNKIQRGSRWNETSLKNGISELIGQDFDVLKLGFDTAEIDILLASSGVEPEEGELDLADQTPATAQRDDIFTVGPHRIACGDCRDASLVAQLMGEGHAAACITDAPYNVAVIGHVSGLGKNQHDEFAMASGEMSSEEYEAFLREVIAVGNALVQPGGYHYWWMDWRSLHLLTKAALDNGLDHVNTCVWVKPNAGMGSLYRSQHEMIGVYRKPGANGTNNVKLGKYGRARSNVWDGRGANSFGRTRDEDLKDHPTVKSIALTEDAIKDCTKRGEIVLDLFGGSGTTMLAAERCSRKARLVEIEPKYVDVTLRRMRDVFEIDAIHVATGLTFNELREQRLTEAKS
jgi:DNA modification methylase